MANHKSAAKRARQTEKLNSRMGAVRSAVSTFEKKVTTAIASNKKKEAEESLVTFASKIGKAAQKGIVESKRASRRVSRLAHQIHQLK